MLAQYNTASQHIHNISMNAKTHKRAPCTYRQVLLHTHARLTVSVQLTWEVTYTSLHHLTPYSWSRAPPCPHNNQQIEQPSGWGSATLSRLPCSQVGCDRERSGVVERGLEGWKEAGIGGERMGGLERGWEWSEKRESGKTFRKRNRQSMVVPIVDLLFYILSGING